MCKILNHFNFTTVRILCIFTLIATTLVVKRIIAKRYAKNPKMKYILLWTSSDKYPFTFLKNQHDIFIKLNCPVQNCYVTDNAFYFGGDVTWFDAVLFNGREHFVAPPFRRPDQLYVYVNTGSVEKPICDAQFDGFYNMTATSKPDSDILFTHLTITNVHGEVVGPKHSPKGEMNWIENMKEINENFSDNIRTKTKTIAWYVPEFECSAINRTEVIKNLQKALTELELNVDIYGKCGNINCTLEQSYSGRPRTANSCTLYLDRDYFFYVIFENSSLSDNAIEKLLYVLESYAVPVVFGSANYSLLLSPGSYLDGRSQSPQELAKTMYLSMKSPDVYKRFFNWKSYYRYKKGLDATVCGLCEMINKKARSRHSCYTNFRSWWYPDYQKACLH